MHKRAPEFFVIDILISIDKIKRRTSDLKGAVYSPPDLLIRCVRFFFNQI